MRGLEDDQPDREKIENIRFKNNIWRKILCEPTPPTNQRGNGKGDTTPFVRYDGTKTKGFDVGHIIKRGETETIKVAMEWKLQKKSIGRPKAKRRPKKRQIYLVEENLKSH